MFALLGALIVRSDSASAPTKLRVVYLGRIAADQDPGFGPFSNALTQLPAELRSRIDLRYVTALLADRKDRIPQAIDEAVAMQPQIIIAPNTTVASAVRQRRLPVPVVFSSFLNPVRNQVVSSTLRRDEPFAGVWIADDMDSKRLEVLHDAYPAVKTVAVLMDRDWGEDTDAASKLPAVGQRLGLQVSLLYAEDLIEAEQVLARPEAAKFDAWCLPPTGLTYLYASELLDRIKAWRKPVILGETRDVLGGAPLSYMVEESFRWGAMAELVARVLQGEPAGSIPIQRPLKSILAVRPVPSEGFPPPSAQVVRRADVVVR
jgi:putative tryptophan/tyrosine transport system substrate-binding protein